jgi:hypothetical protein
MPKRGLSKHVGSLRSKLYQAAKYHWEFRRRNQAYRLWWQQGLQADIKPKGWDERFDPDIPFDKLIKESTGRAISGIQHPVLKKVLSENPERSLLESALEFLFMQGMMPKGVKQKFGPAWMTIKIDFNKIRDSSALREYVSLAIEDVYNLNVMGGFLEGANTGARGKTLTLKKDFERILDAGDMHRNGNNYRQIADKHFSNDDDREGARIKAFNLVKEYKKLVNGGYLKIIFP